jgi:nifR3 family TIM-barrel protein
MKIGPIQLDAPFCQAGLAGYSDRAMRRVARRRGCPYAVTEALLDVILLSGGQGLKKSIDIADDDHPVAGQVIGSEPEQMARAARIMADHGYDVVDLNFACPVKKIKNKARGGHMLTDLPRATAILRACRDVVPARVPITVSLRRAFAETAESEDLFYRVFDEVWASGCAAARVHARTVEQKYLGPSRWPFLKRLKGQYPGRTILGSGDVFTAADAVRMLRETGVDVVWIARGAIGNPWIFRHARALLGGAEASSISPPTIGEQREALQEHFALAMQIHGEQLAGRRMRKMGIKYSRFHPRADEVKRGFIDVHSLRDWTNVLAQWYAQDGPGVWPAANAADEVNAEADLQSCETAAG